jgi:hypothetical protein
MLIACRCARICCRAIARWSTGENSQRAVGCTAEKGTSSEDGGEDQQNIGGYTQNPSPHPGPSSFQCDTKVSSPLWKPFPVIAMSTVQRMGAAKIDRFALMSEAMGRLNVTEKRRTGTAESVRYAGNARGDFCAGLIRSLRNQLSGKSHPLYMGLWAFVLCPRRVS